MVATRLTRPPLVCIQARVRGSGVRKTQCSCSQSVRLNVAYLVVIGLVVERGVLLMSVKWRKD